jgi:hypothetical protein
MGTFLLIGCGISIIGFSYLLPTGPIGNLVVVNACITIIIFSMLELFLIMTHLEQEGYEEQPSDENKVKYNH